MESWKRNYGLLMQVVALLLALLQLSSAALHTVGDSSGWTFQVNYTQWAAKQTFQAGDILLFPYAQGMHNVLEVNKAGYDSCSTANAISTYATANASVTLSKSGEHWFICGIPEHCTGGMKLAVNVLASPSGSPSQGQAPSTQIPPPPPTTTRGAAAAPASSASSQFPAVAAISSVAMAVAGMMFLG